MKKYLDFILIFLLILLTFQFFSSKESQPQQGVVFTTSDNNYTIPATIFLSIENNTSEELRFNSCSDIEITTSTDGSTIEIPQSYCSDIALLPGEDAKVDYSKLYETFSTPATYTFQLDVEGKKYLSQTQVEHRGTIGKIFVGLFYAPVFNALAYIVQFFSYSLGWGIILVTILIRIVLLYPQHKMMVSQRKLQKIQPKIKRIQEKYK